MIEVEVENFQSIDHVKVNFQGFTALVGRSNIGKSALIRAIKFALTNSEGKSFVRHNHTCLRKIKNSKTCKCQTTVKINMEGFDLKWEKGDAVNRYTFNGKEYDKPDRGVPDFLVDAGFGHLKMGDDKVCIQVSDQFSPLFLIDRSGSAVAETIADVGKLDRINTAMRSAERDRKETSALRKVREKDIEDIKTKLLPYLGLDEHLTGLDAVKSNLVSVKEKTTSVKLLEGFYSVMVGLGLSLKSLGTITSIVVPDSSTVTQPYQSLIRLDKLVTSLFVKEAQCKKLDWVDHLPELNSKSLEVNRDILKSLESWLGRLRVVKEVFTKLGSVDQISVVDLPAMGDKLETLLVSDRLYTRYLKANQQVSRYDGLKSILDYAETLPKNVPSLANDIKYLGQVESKYKSLLGSVDKLDQEYEKTTKEQNALQKEIDILGVCPTCTKPLWSEAHKNLTGTGC